MNEKQNIKQSFCLRLNFFIVIILALNFQQTINLIRKIKKYG